MRQTLFFVPHELYGIPVFGFGWALVVLVVAAIVIFIVTYRQHGSADEFWGFLPVLGIAALAAYFLLPALEVKGAEPKPLGLPIRGYGMFVLFGIVSGVALSVYRTRQIGMDESLVYSLILWLIFFAIPGARLFYIVQYLPNFIKPTFTESVVAMIKFTDGGIVVFGALLGGLLALYMFSRRHSINMFELGDIVAPGMVLGLAFGRIGCLMNGCCYGGVCAASSLAVTFPMHPYPAEMSAKLKQYSPPYEHQLAYGHLYGFRLESDLAGRAVVQSVQANSAADHAGLQAGMRIEKLNDKPIADVSEARQFFLEAPQTNRLLTTKGDFISWLMTSLPPRSLPTYPTQIYSSINALLLCLVVWFVYPFRRRHGEVLVALLVLYSLARFVLEAIRTDEVGQWDTPFTISQIVSMLVLVVGLAMWFYLRRQPVIKTTVERSGG